MEFQFRALELKMIEPFRIATRRTGGRSFTNVVVSLSDPEGLTGEGEGHPTLYYGETPEITLAALAHLRRELPATDLASLTDARIAEIMSGADRLLAANNAAKAALEGALQDLRGKQQGVTVREALKLGSCADPETSFTIGLAEPGTMLELARTAVARGFGILKIKAGGPGAVELIERIRLETGARIFVDANGAWTAAEALPILERLAMAGVELVEQPLAADDLAGYRAIAARAPLPIVLDESIRCPLDLEVFGEYADGVNLKISKLGGIGPSLALARRAQLMKLDLMMGCMVESSLGIAQGLQLAPLLKWVDLDGFLLVSEDPYRGLVASDGRLALTTEPGLGVQRGES
ncbi:MAG: dipeptide epimerase [bacterium]|nr:dipeptide epimerase [bacterium]